ncbi:MAG TPA: diacylglycerol kinase family protein [Bacteroidales bacterium]|nr:diacylglycerol kinase family protein [Bacteroidales bacterium]
MKQQINNGYLVIVNPNAGKGLGEKDWKKISSLLKNEGIHFVEKFTEKKGHAIRLAAEGVNSGFRRIITVGGDGTLNEIVNGIFLNSVCYTPEVSLGMIPVGTGNDWVRMFGIPGNYTEAVKIIKADKTMLHDAGVVSYYNGDEKQIRYFINIAGVGFESAVVRRTNNQKEKGYGGKLVYFYNLLVTLSSYRNKKVLLTIDSEQKKARIFSVNVGNGRYCGGGMRQTPNAIPDDGWLDVTVINSMRKFEIIRNLQILYNGKILEHPKVDGYRCRKFDISSEIPVYTEADGEFLGHTPAEFTVIPGALKVIYGERLIPLE